MSPTTIQTTSEERMVMLMLGVGYWCVGGMVCGWAEAAVLGAIDYKTTFAKTYENEEEQLEAYSECHRRSAERVLKALLANGGTSFPTLVICVIGLKGLVCFCLEGVFIKLGQHMASMYIPPENSKLWAYLIPILVPNIGSSSHSNGPPPCVPCRTNASPPPSRTSKPSSSPTWVDPSLTYSTNLTRNR